MEMGSLEGWENWDDDACVRFAIAVSKEKGRRYAIAYRYSKRCGRTEKAIALHRSAVVEMQYIEEFFTRGFLGAIFDGEEALQAIRSEVDRQNHIIKYRGEKCSE